MMTLAPLRAWRYDAQKVGALGDVWAPPYDVISPEAAAELRSKHANNFVRLTQPEASGSGRYADAARTLDSWIADGILVRDDAPSLYVHRHHFELNGEQHTRVGVWGLLRLVPYEAGIVLAHERTMKGPKADRLALMKACRAHLSPIFFICSDPDGSIGRILGDEMAGAASERAEFPAGQTHELWRVSEPAALDRIARSMSEQVYLIADGHHRYETALAYREALLSEGAPAAGQGGGGGGGGGGHHYILAYVVPEGDRGLSLEPTHRVMSGDGHTDWRGAIAAMEDDFRVQKLGGGAVGDAMALLEDRAGRASFVLVVRGEEGGWLLEPKESVTDIPAVALHEMFLAKLPGWSDAQSEGEGWGRVSYTRDPAEALEDVRSGAAQAAALLASSTVGQIREAARAGQRLPTKTTYFRPKVPTGIAIHRIDPGEEIGTG